MKEKNRVKSHQDFQTIIHHNTKKCNKNFVLYYCPNDLGYTRIGISTSKKLGNAVIRARIRRQMRVITKTILGLENSMDFIVIVRKDYLKMTFQENSEELRKLYIDILK